MTDLEMTRLAAKLFPHVRKNDVRSYVVPCAHFERDSSDDFGPYKYFSPLTNPAQAFELLDTLCMRIIEADSHKIVLLKSSDNIVAVSGAADLKRAIVECAANYQLEKEKQA